MSRRSKKIARYREQIKGLEEENNKLKIKETMLKVTINNKDIQLGQYDDYIRKIQGELADYDDRVRKAEELIRKLRKGKVKWRRLAGVRGAHVARYKGDILRVEKQLEDVKEKLERYRKSKIARLCVGDY